jgi:ABC-type protease/lipase transport system fused ATPase/permease subunit
MRLVIGLSPDIRRATRVAAAFSGLAAALVVCAVLFGRQVVVWHSALDQFGISLLTMSIVLLLLCSVALIAIREQILLRTGIWFGHAFAHQHLARRANDGATLDRITTDERAIRAIQSALVDGYAGKRADALWLPVYWLGLASIDPTYGALAVAAACTFGLTAFLLGRKRTVSAKYVTLYQLHRTQNVASTDIDQWEQSNRAATSVTYRNAIRSARYRRAQQLSMAACVAGLAYATAWTADAATAAPVDLLCCGILQARSLLLVWTVAAAWPSSQYISLRAGELSAPLQTHELVPPCTVPQPNAQVNRRVIAPDFRHAA